MDEIILASFFQWVEENESDLDYSLMFESCENSILCLMIGDKLAKINFKSAAASSTSKDHHLVSWIEFVNHSLSSSKPSKDSEFAEFFGKIFAHFSELQAFSSEEEIGSSDENYHEEIVDAIHKERVQSGEEVPARSLGFYASHFLYTEAEEAVRLLEQTLEICPRLKYSVNIRNNKAFCNVRLELDLAFLEIPDSVMVVLGLNYESPLVVSCSVSDIRLSQTTMLSEWTPSLLGYLDFDVMQAGVGDSYGCREYILGRVKKFRETMYNMISSQQGMSSFLALSRENSTEVRSKNEDKVLINKLIAMGYSKSLVKEAVAMAKGSEDLAIEYLDNENINKYSGEYSNEITICNNFFYNLLFYLRDRIQNCTNYCFICYKRHIVESVRLRPCSSEMCEFRFEEISGISVFAELTSNPSLVLLDISFAAESATSGRNLTVFEPFPSFLLKKNQIRGKSGFLSGMTYSTDMDSNKDIALLRNLISAIPNLNTIKSSCVDEITCRDFISLQCPDGLLMYKLLRYIVATNRLNMVKLEENLRIKELHEEMEQYIVMNHSPETEKNFAERKKVHGSFFAFHGSAIENWYSILRNGIRNLSNTHMMTAGAAHGPGVYCAENISTSFGYCRFTNTNCIWPYSQLSNPPKACMAIIEVIKKEKNFKSGGIYVVNDDKDLIIRYMLIFPGSSMGVNVNAGNLNLEKHYIATKQGFQKRENDYKKARIEKAIKKAKTLEETAKTPQKPQPEENKIAPEREEKLQKIEAAFSGRGSSLTNKRILQEYKYLINSKECNGLTAEFQGDSNMYIWDVKVDINKFEVPKELKKDFEDYAKRYNRDPELVFEMRFDSNYPFTPPFLRVIRPRFAFRTGHVTIGGSICMQSITPSGWIPVRTIESVFIEILFNMAEGGARLDLHSSSVDYQLAEAQEAFTRVAKQHSWI